MRTSLFCGRRDFAEGTTYNRLCLVLNADGTGNVLRRYEPWVQGMPAAADVEGVLLPSATVIKNFLGRELVWRVRLEHPPRQRLQYHFLRSSFDPEDVSNLHNVEENSLSTPRECRFDSALQVVLKTADDGTVHPKFIYRAGRTEAESVSVEGRPFFLDMTYGAGGRPAKAYIGFDFGTSNSSVSFVDERRVRTYTARQNERSWRRLGELLDTVPVVVAEPLARYLGETDPGRVSKRALECIEASLTLAGYVAYADWRVHKRRAVTRILKGFTQRSGGPLWGLLKDVLTQLGAGGWVSSEYAELLKPEYSAVIDEALRTLVDFKHDKLSGEIANPVPAIELLANITDRVFATRRFGFFHDVRKARFRSSYTGLFREAHGRQPFTKILNYIGTDIFSEAEVVVADPKTGTVLCLAPLMFWHRCDVHREFEWGHCYLYDSESQRGYEFKAAGYSCALTISPETEYEELFEKMRALKVDDTSLDLLAAGELRTRDADG